MDKGVRVSRLEEVAFWIVEDYRRGKHSLEEAALLLGVSPRTVMRRAKRVREHGLVGLKHANCGRHPANKLTDVLKDQVVALIRDRYFDFNLVHAREKLRDCHGITVSYATLYAWTRTAGVGRGKSRRRPSKARIRRERMANEGLLLQMDGSHHCWNGKDEWCLIAMIDDATSDVPCAEFFAGETTIGCLKMLRRLVESRGIPDIIYTDEAGWADRPEGKRPHFSQFKRACEELGIRLITTRSPQSKGRIERSWRTAQDRLVPEFRLAGIKSMSDGNRYLEQVWLPYWRRELTVEPRSTTTRYRPLPAHLELDQVLCMKHSRTVASDQTISFENQRYRITDRRFGSLKGQQVDIHVQEDRPLEIYHGHLRLTAEPWLQPRRRWREGA